MNNKILIIFISLCILTLFACSSTNLTTTLTPVATHKEKAVVYIYRPAAMSNAMYSPDFLVNNEIKFSLKIGKKYLLKLPPVNTTFEIEPEKNYSGITQLKFPLKPNKRYYLRVDTTLKINNSISYETYQRGFTLVRVDEKSALAEIAECCAQKTKNIAKSKEVNSTPKEKNSGDSFSVDKTQNPFSH